MKTVLAALILSSYSITDGDTLRSGETRIRLWGIDAPEAKRPGGFAATRYLKRLTNGQILTCKPLDKDRYGRVVARCSLPDGTDPACAMVAAGHARDWPRYSGGYYARCAD
jgi:endonuclease YncB( thermonuclease family)